MASRRAWTVAWSSHRRASGDAAWMAPNANPHRTGTRIDWPVRGVGVGTGMGVMAGAAWRRRGGIRHRWPPRWGGRPGRWAAMATRFRLAGGEPWGIRGA